MKPSCSEDTLHEMLRAGNNNRNYARSLYGQFAQIFKPETKIKRDTPSSYNYNQHITSNQPKTKYRIHNTRHPHLKIINQNNISKSLKNSPGKTIREMNFLLLPPRQTFHTFRTGISNVTRQEPTTEKRQNNNYSQLKSMMCKQIQKSSLPNRYHNIMDKFSGSQLAGELKSQLAFVPGSAHKLASVYHKNYKTHKQSRNYSRRSQEINGISDQKNQMSTEGDKDSRYDKVIVIHGNRMAETLLRNTNWDGKQKQVDNIKDHQIKKQQENIKFCENYQKKSIIHRKYLAMLRDKNSPRQAPAKQEEDNTPLTGWVQY